MLPLPLLQLTGMAQEKGAEAQEHGGNLVEDVSKGG